MSVTAYHEPYKLPAGILALTVHGIFFAFLYFGFNWNRQISSPALATMSVELLQGLPLEVAQPPVNPQIAEVKPTLPVKVAEPDIAMPEKKAPERKPAEKKKLKPEKIKPEKKTHQPDIKQPVRQSGSTEQRNPAASATDRQATPGASDRGAQDAAKGRVVAEYGEKIRAKIHHNIVMPSNVANEVSVEYLVTLLPGGAVLPPRLIKSSGNAAYDEAVERAILKSDPLPLPPDAALFKDFRELHLTFKPEKKAE